MFDANLCMYACVCITICVHIHVWWYILFLPPRYVYSFTFILVYFISKSLLFVPFCGCNTIKCPFWTLCLCLWTMVNHVTLAVRRIIKVCNRTCIENDRGWSFTTPFVVHLKSPLSRPFNTISVGKSLSQSSLSQLANHTRTQTINTTT